MELSEDRIKGYMRRLLLSRMRLLCTNGFYGLLVMHLKFALDRNCETAATDGERILFGPEFLDGLSDAELDFILMHEVLHVALRHHVRCGERDRELYNIACDIVVNSNILKSLGMDESRITVGKYGVSMHKAPDGKEGYEYTVEQMYALVLAAASSGKGQPDKDGKNGKGSGKDRKDEKGSGKDGKNGKDSGKKDGQGKGSGKQRGDGSGNFRDDHSRWEKEEEDEWLSDLWEKRIEDAAEAVMIRDPSNKRGLIPEFAARILKDLKAPQTDWRTILDGFVQEEITDYSFMPPDRRMSECDFFLPDFNEKEEIVTDILFMIDTSGSMSDEMVTAAYSEVKGAIDQFDGKLKGWLGFFDASVTEPKPFADEEDLRIIRPYGGGGTDFKPVFAYVRDRMQDRPPASIIILTDGYAPFPPEGSAMGIPVLWLLNNESVKPPWGKVARITLDF